MYLICKHCGSTKPAGDFSIQYTRKDGTEVRNLRCRVCVNASSVRRYNGSESIRKDRFERSKKWKQGPGRFNKSLHASRSDAKRSGYVPCSASVEELRNAFTGKCHVCGIPELECAHGLHMDHSHETGIFRGWLCKKCNTALGMLNESPEIIFLLAEYAEKHQLV